MASFALRLRVRRARPSLRETPAEFRKLLGASPYLVEYVIQGRIEHGVAERLKSAKARAEAR